MTQLQSYTFDELPVGKKATYARTVTEKDIQLFAVVSGDVNPLHLNAEFAKGTQFGERKNRRYHHRASRNYRTQRRKKGVDHRL
jgi:acyl dehydratase